MRLRQLIVNYVAGRSPAARPGVCVYSTHIITLIAKSVNKLENVNKARGVGRGASLSGVER